MMREEAAVMCYGNDADNGQVPKPERMAFSPEKPANVMTARMSIGDMIKILGVMIALCGLLVGGVWSVVKDFRDDLRNDVMLFRGDLAALRGDVIVIREKQASINANLEDISRRTARMEAAADKKP